MTHPPDTGLVDHVLRSREHAAAESAEVLVERDVDAVEQRRDIAKRTAVEGLTLPQPRAVEVQRDAVRPRPLRLGDEASPRRKLTAEVALRELEQQRSEWLRHRFEIVEGNEPIAVSNRPRLEPVQVRVAAFL